MDKVEAARKARQLLSQNHAAEAFKFLWYLAEQTHLVDAEYDENLRQLANCYRMVGRPRNAAFVHLYLHDVQRAAQLFGTAPRDIARCQAISGDHRSGAAQFLEAGRPAHAAIEYERAKDDPAARVLWERISQDPRSRSDPYVSSLVSFNLGRCCARLGDRAAARKSLVNATRLLEEAADDFETRGLRERAFDCFQILMTLGRDEKQFENLAEGYLNCIRILKEDHLKYYVLQYFEDFQKIALEREEHHAAATLFRESAEYCQRLGLPYERSYRKRCATTWVLGAHKTIADGGPLELAENAYLAAIDGFNALGDYVRVKGCYDALCKLELGVEKQKRYARISARYDNAYEAEVDAPPFPDYLRQDTAYPDIWYLDLIEWEQAGDIGEVSTEILVDLKYPDVTRRKALLCRLHALDAPEGDEEQLAVLAERLGQIQLYASLSPLERMVTHPAARVRAAVMRALRTLFYKRSFGLLVKGLADPEAAVRRDALAAVSALHFPHAFDPLVRIFREATDPEVKLAALGSVGRINTLEAADFLLEVLRHGESQFRTTAKDLLVNLDLQDLPTILRQSLALETGESRNLIAQVLRAKGDFGV
ncbi:MAG: HEAT repeat domain-containing protein [Deltaproteobacteria bacterium]|nr:HEAT repeat domain-containing protein [Deltaproteobacteria bacterium]